MAKSKKEKLDAISKREQGYASSLEAQIAAATRAGLATYTESLMHYVDTIETLDALGNFQLSYGFRIAGNRRISFDLEIPKVIALAPQFYGPKTQNIQSTFFIASTTSSTRDIDSKTHVEGEGSFGFGLFKFRSKMSATVGVKENKQRKDDQRSTFDTQMELGLVGVPEGIARVRDTFLAGFDALAQKMIEQLAAKIEEIAETGDLVEIEEISVEDAGAIPEKAGDE